MTNQVMQALGRVLDHYGPDEIRHYTDSGEPSGHIGEALLTLQRFRKHRSLDDVGLTGSQIANLTITDPELEAIRSVEQWICYEIQREHGEPPSEEPSPDDMALLHGLLARHAPTGEVASRPNGEPPQPEDSQGPSVVDRDGPDIKWRWAKEAVGLTALELNEAYAEFSVTGDEWSTPNGKLHRAAERLKEVMQRLGLTDEGLIPF